MFCFCTSQRQSRRPHPHEVMLIGADGLDWESFCDCACLYAVRSADLFWKTRACDSGKAAPNPRQNPGCLPSVCNPLSQCSYHVNPNRFSGKSREKDHSRADLKELA